MAQNDGLPTWIDFDSIDVKDGMTVAVNNSLEQTGQVFLDRNRATPSYQTVIKGQRLLLNPTGKVIVADPGVISVDTVLKILTWDMDQTHSVVTGQTRAEGGQATLTESTLRDQFAMNILNAMIAAAPELKDADDASMFSAATIAYRFAEAMMRSAADYRANENDEQEQQEVGSDTVISGSVKIENTSTTNNGVTTKNPLIIDGSGTNGELTVKGNDTYHPDDNPSNDIAGVLNVNVVAGGGEDLATLNSGVSNNKFQVNNSGAIDIGATGLGRDASHPIHISGGGGSSTDVVHIGSSTNGRGESSSYPFVVKGGDSYTPTGGTQIDDVIKVAIVAGGGGGGSVDKGSVPTVQPSLTYTLEHVLVFQYDSYSTSLRKVALGDLGVPVLQTISNGNFPSYSDIKKGYYYKFITTKPTVVDIDLPAAAVPNGDIVNIVIFSFELDATANFSVTAQNNNEILYRESNPGATLAKGIYEIDCLADGNRWIIGVTKLVSN